MPESLIPLEEEILELYRSPIIGASYNNTYGEENIKSLVEKFSVLDEQKSQTMQDLVVLYSKSPDLATSYVSVAVLHALGMSKKVQEAYLWAKGLDESETFIHHFDIGKSLAEYFT
ncbi:MAG: hypothetical protein HOB58_10700 [Nitrospina sp.]|nr:hypothetical protein [Nitrospina sp.]